MTEFSSILSLLSFPPASHRYLCEAEEALRGCQAYVRCVTAAVREYGEKGTLNYEEYARSASEAALSHSYSEYTGALLFFLALVPLARDFYIKEGRDPELFAASFSDLALKSNECFKVHGVWGVDTNWFGRFFDRTRFMLGRLEFESYHLSHPFAGYEVGHPAINVHIPECGPLNHSDCLAAYELAVKAFPECIRDGKAVFVCSSWLLAGELADFLPAQSNIRIFASDYTILNLREQQGFPDGWRVFADKCKLPPAELPTDTALRRGYAKHLQQYGSTTVGYGAFLYDVQRNMII